LPELSSSASGHKDTAPSAIQIVSGGSESLFGRYSPPGTGAGIDLTLLDRGVFLADWWGREWKNDDFLGGWISGKWKKEGDRVTLWFDSKGKKGCICVFRVEVIQDREALQMVKPSVFPLAPNFGTDYFRHAVGDRFF
jgi:hypothetical protein